MSRDTDDDEALIRALDDLSASMAWLYGPKIDEARIDRLLADGEPDLAAWAALGRARR